MTAHEPDRQARYDREWRRFRRLRAAFWILFAGLFPILFFGAAIKSLLGLSAGGFVELLLAYIAMVWVTGYNVSGFPCPRCGRVFAGKRWFGLVSMAQRCNFCKLPLWGGCEDTKLPGTPIS
ncbi:MAG TPA: hypothetical protein VGR84_00590 [Candidatus Acidoferrales bacterium]|nr:hypothetical protein [Candidatus Acidoferrales bacterium]